MAGHGQDDAHVDIAKRELEAADELTLDPQISTDSVPSLAVESRDVLHPNLQKRESRLPHHGTNDTLHTIDRNQTDPEILKDISIASNFASSASSRASSNGSLSQAWGRSNDTVTPDDYFASKNLHRPHVTDFAHNAPSPPTSTSTPRNSSGLASLESSAPPSPDNRFDGAWKDLSAHSNSTSTFHPAATRPTSVPNFQTQNLSRRREGPEYPNYPNQSFRALQDQYHPPPYKPGSSNSNRTRSSHPSQSLSSSSNDFPPMSDTPQLPSGAKTVGNTPAQSPGLFSPAPQPRKHRAGDSDDGRSGTPMLHPTHHKPPKETHKLLKDIDPISGRKTINHYEILQKLGSGQHGTVKQGKDLENGELVAIKIVRRFSKKLRLGRQGDPKDMIKKEVAILKKARHPHVVSLIEVIDDDEFGKVYLVLEYVERGEIVWRKQTDKDIAAFERERIQRERANTVDDEYERAAVRAFNEGASTRRVEKARLLDVQKRQARERFGARGTRSRVPSSSDFWSLEFERDGEGDGCENASRQPNSFHEDTRQHPGSALSTQGATVSPQSESQLHTPRPQNQMHPLFGSGSASVPSSRPDTPARSETSVWSPYSDESFSNLRLRATLDEIIAGHDQWTPEEEDFRCVPCLTLTQALDVFRDTVLGLEYLHYQGIIHRDIKPANLLWTADYRVKISDFGVSYLGKPIREDDNNEEIEEADPEILDEAIELAKTVGTPAFYAPELCDPLYFEVGKHANRPAITSQIDVWALGVTLYGMVFGRLPFFHHNQFQMYERIAREEVFIPRWRLKGVEHTDKTPSNHNKRLEDVLEYEEVDDELRDLLKRLLDKHPAKRITLKEVKHHPWVLRGISDQTSWVDETDPSVQSQGRKIEVSTQEVQDAVVGLTLVDRGKAFISRVGSVLRGRGSRKRADSNPKYPETQASESRPPGSASSTTLAGSRPESSVSSSSIQDARRSSLRGDELITVLRASRENSEHPLAQSVAASPELKEDFNAFDEGRPPRPVSDPQAMRPTFSDRSLSTADSMKTIRAPVPPAIREATQIFTPSPEEQFSPTTAVIDPNVGSISSLGGIFGGASRHFPSSIRSRERGSARHGPSHSRSSSVDTNAEDSHASPSLALSSALAAGQLDPPPALRQEPEIPSYLPGDPTNDSVRLAQEEHARRQALSSQGHSRRPTASIAAGVPCPPSPSSFDDETIAQQRPTSAADSTTAFQISSSSDQIVSGESTAHSRIPSVVSGASSLSATVEEKTDLPVLHLEKSISPLTIGRRSESQSREQRTDETLNPKVALASAAAEEEAAYNGEGEQDDSDSEDEGLAMA